MALDVYQSCPGGLPKKIKFCQCGKDILGDLGKIIDAIGGGQRAGAISHINRLLESKGGRPCLLALKGLVQLQMQDYEGLAETADEFLQAHPENPIASGLSSVTVAVRGDIEGAIEYLQNALRDTDEVMHEAVFHALEIVSQLLVEFGETLAARAHLGLLIKLTPPQARQSIFEVLLRMLSNPSIPLLLKQQFTLMNPPEDVVWRDACQAALDRAEHGVWAEALERFKVLGEELPNEPVIWHNAAVLAGYLARQDETAEAWHHYASLDRVALDDAVEAEALAQMLSHEDNAMIDEVTQVYRVTDSDQVLERLLSEKQIDMITGDLSSLGTEDSPPPKAAFWVLDRQLPEGSDDIALEDIPNVLGQGFLYGRETDREPRVEFVTARTDDFESKSGLIKRVLGDLGAEIESEETSGEMPASRLALAWRWRLPDGVSADRQRSLLKEKYVDVQMNVWPETPSPLLDGKRPVEVADDPAYRVRLLAAILLLEFNGESSKTPFDFNRLRAKLGLPTRDDFPSEGIDIEDVQPVRLHLLVPENLSDKDLATAYSRAWVNRAYRATARLGKEVLKRPSLKNRFDFDQVHYAQSVVATDPDDALQSIQDAEETAIAAGRSPAPWMVHELEIRLMRGEPKECQRLLSELNTRHIDEPGIQQAIYAWLVRIGVVRPSDSEGMPPSPQQPPADPAAAPGPEAPAAPGEIWTPGNDKPASPGKDKPGIWVPGMD